MRASFLFLNVKNKRQHREQSFFFQLPGFRNVWYFQCREISEAGAVWVYIIKCSPFREELALMHSQSIAFLQGRLKNKQLIRLLTFFRKVKW